MTDLPDPPVPANCDLRDFPRIMIDITRLFGSSFNATASRNPLAWMIGHKLWYRSWQQVPASSLPNDDDELCYLAELGFDLASFQSVRDLAMRGWVLCSDGRLYHPVVAEAARDAFGRKLQKRFATECSRIKKFNQRHKTSHPFPEFDAFVANGCRPVMLLVSGDNASCPPGQSAMSPGTPPEVPRDVPPMSPGKSTPRDREGKGHSNIELAKASSCQPALAAVPSDIEIAFSEWVACRAEIRTNAKPIFLTNKRRANIGRRLQEIGGLPGWRDVLAEVRKSPLLRGDKTDWRAEIDWLLNPTNLTKVREGNYDDGIERKALNGSIGSTGVRTSTTDTLRQARAFAGFDGP
jgi:hypothetical protein